MSGLPSLLEVMQLVSGQVQGADSAASVELTGSSDPLRITARHALTLQQRTLTVMLDVYNRLPVDVRNAFIRLHVSAVLTQGKASATSTRQVINSQQQPQACPKDPSLMKIQALHAACSRCIWDCNERVCATCWPHDSAPCYLVLARCLHL